MKRQKSCVLLALSLAANVCMAESLLRVNCEGDNAGAEVLVNGKFKGECPIDVKVHEGTVKLRVQKAVDAWHDPRLFEQDIHIGDDVVKKVEAQLGEPRLNAEGQREMAALNCQDCPEMAIVPAGSFQMGSTGAEADHENDESPVHRVEIARFAMGKYEVTVGEFRKFVQATGYKTDAETDTRPQSLGCYLNPVHEPARWEAGRNWSNPGFSQSERDPAVCISWRDAQAYTKWLGDQTGKAYRLPSESEWEYAARANTTGARYWAGNLDQACRYANASDQTEYKGYHWNQRFECNDGHWYTAPAGSYQPNAFGLYDMLGNVWEWVGDTYHGNYIGAPATGTEWNTPDNDSHKTIRGGAWDSAPRLVRAAARLSVGPARRESKIGFRLAMTMPAGNPPARKRSVKKSGEPGKQGSSPVHQSAAKSTRKTVEHEPQTCCNTADATVPHGVSQTIGSGVDRHEPTDADVGTH